MVLVQVDHDGCLQRDLGISKPLAGLPYDNGADVVVHGIHNQVR